MRTRCAARNRDGRQCFRKVARQRLYVWPLHEAVFGLCGNHSLKFHREGGGRVAWPVEGFVFVGELRRAAA